jgi:hypothetical protein
VDVSGLENYRSIQRVDNEGKNLFDFVTSSVWNARKQMADWLCPHFSEENELVDLFMQLPIVMAGSGQRRLKSWFGWSHCNSRDGGKLRKCFAVN